MESNLKVNKTQISDVNGNIVFICGHSGSGKSTFAEVLAKELGYKHINVDHFCFDVCRDEEFLKVATEEIGEHIYDENGQLVKSFEIGSQVLYNRNGRAQKCAKIFFDNVEIKLRELTAEGSCVVEWFALPLLKVWQGNSLKVLVKVSDEQVRIKRIMDRKPILESMLREREKARVEYDIDDFDVVFNNDGSKEEMLQAVVGLRSIIDSLVCQ